MTLFRRWLFDSAEVLWWFSLGSFVERAHFTSWGDATGFFVACWVLVVCVFWLAAFVVDTTIRVGRALDRRVNPPPPPSPPAPLSVTGSDSWLRTSGGLSAVGNDGSLRFSGGVDSSFSVLGSRKVPDA